MIGDVLLAVVLVLLLALSILLLIPVSLRVSYAEGRFSAWMHYASKTIMLYPGGEKPSEEATMEDSAKKAKKKAESKTKTSEKPNWEQISYSLDMLPRVLCRALRCTMRRIRIRPLKLHVLVAQSDPADTAVLYGKLQGVCNSILPALHCAVRVEEQDIELFPDFCGGKMDYILDLGIRIRPLDVLGVALSAAGGLIRWYSGYKKRAERPAAAQDIGKETAA